MAFPEGSPKVFARPEEAPDVASSSEADLFCLVLMDALVDATLTKLTLLDGVNDDGMT